MKPTFGYIRVSTQKQGEGVSLIAQKEAITAYAAKNNLSIVEWFEEKETAAKSGRPIFDRMLRCLRAGEADSLIMHKIDRSARNLKDWSLVAELPEMGINVHFATETLDFRSRGGRLAADIQAVIAADYIRNLREETIKGINGRLKQGYFPFNAPLGYRDNGGGKVKTICPIKGPLVRECFVRYGSGAYSLESLQQFMKTRGLTNKRGKPVSEQALSAILANPFYIGIMRVKGSGATYKGLHEPLVDNRTWRAALAAKEGKSGKKETRHNHLYRGLFRCGLCGNAMTPEMQKGHVYYRCHRQNCLTTTVREDDIEKSVRETLCRLSFKLEDEAALIAKFDAYLSGTARQDTIQNISMRKANAQSRMDRLTDLLVDGTLNKTDFDNRKRSLHFEIAQLDEELIDAQKLDVQGDTLSRFLELMKSLAGLYEIATPEEKRAFLKNVCSNRYVVRKNIVLEPQNWLVDRDFRDLSKVVAHIVAFVEGMELAKNSNLSNYDFEPQRSSKRD